MRNNAASTTASAKTPMAIAVPVRIINDPKTMGKYRQLKSASADQ